MCGIAGIYLRDPSFRSEVDLDAMTGTLIDEIDHRGKHACGVVAIGDDGVGLWQKAAVSAWKFNNYRKPVPDDSRLVLAHTRWATQGDPGFMENNHPIKRGPFFIIHNGHVSNDIELFRKSERKRFGQVDSEAIAARLSSFESLSKLEAVMAEIRGGAAVAAVDERDPTRLAIAKGLASPLHVYAGEKLVVFASTKAAIRKAIIKNTKASIDETRWHELNEGDAWEWHGDILIKRQFTVLARYQYTYTTPANRTGTGTGTKWMPGSHIVNSEDLKSGGTTKRKTKAEKKAERKAKRNGAAAATAGNGDKPWAVRKPRGSVISVDDEHISCEHCGDDVHWTDINYFRPEGVTFLVCEDCFNELIIEFEDDGDVIVGGSASEMLGMKEDDLEEVRETLPGIDSNDYAERGLTLVPTEDDIVSDDLEVVNKSVLRNFLGI